MKSITVILAFISLSLASAQTIVCPPDALANVKLAAKEIRRYIYLRTGELLPVAASGTGIALRVDAALADQQYRLKGGGKADLVITGGSDVAVLYGAYAFAEKLGVRFELNGDVIPDGRIPLAIPALDEDWQPQFDKRGIQPFHDFPEGPDWWSADEWRLYLGQTVKLRMNFVGLHTYPFSNKDLGPEPLVWVGVPEDVNPDGTVKVADEASWYSTAKTMPYGCYAPGITGDYSFGASLVFPADNHGPEINGPDDFPMPKTPEAKVAMINRTGEFLRPIFAEARGRGIRIAVGTEAPLDIPPTALVRLREMGIDPASPEALHKLYTGMFTRIQRAFPVDYYWLWGHEGEIDEARVTLNVKQAHQALQDMGQPFGLGVCGWGWTAGHFPSLHRNLPPDIFFSAINGSAGHAPLSPNFGRVGDRSRWAIPWVEDDSVLTSIQPRAGRIRRDAADARKYGCDGLMGIFWRTRILSPALTALARAGWSQDGWTDTGGAKAALPAVEVDGGQIVSFLNNKVAGATVEPIYQTVRFGMNGYRFAVPDGDYQVTLHFVEPAYKEAGKRVFGVKLQGRQVIEHLDVFGKVGGFTALKLPFEHIRATNGLLKIEFTPETEYPIIAAIEIEGGEIRRKINCGGPAYQDFAADPAGATPRDLPVADLYADWARAQFGPEAGPPAATIFARLDGKFPAVSGWIRGPGAVVVHNEPWTTYQRQFAFVEEFAALRPLVRGAGSLERFDYWLNMFRATRSMGEFGSLRGELNGIMAAIAREQAPDARRALARDQALPVRLRMTRALGELHESLLAALTNSTELGTLCNIEQQSLLRLRLLDGHDQALAQHLGEPLPTAARPWKDFRGAARVVVLNPRNSLAAGEAQTLRIIALSADPVRSVTVRLRPLGGGEWQSLEASHLARSVWQAKLPAAKEDFEYSVEARAAGGKSLCWPATAPESSQTVITTTDSSSQTP